MRFDAARLGEIWTSRAGRVTLTMSALYAANGVLLPFLARWLSEDRGLIGAQIGAVLSAAQLARILTGPAIAQWGDRVRDRRTPLRLLATMAAFAFALFGFWARDFWSLFVCGFAALTLFSATTPFAEAATLRACETGPLTYGVARGMTSISFIIGSIVGGALIGALGGPQVAPYFIFLAVVASAMLAWTWLSPDPSPPAPHEGQQSRIGFRVLLSNARFVRVIIACGLIQSAHAFYYGFAALNWRAQGVPDTSIGWIWSIGVGAEVAFLWSLTPIERRFQPASLIVIGGAGACLRWIAMSFSPVGPFLWLIQAMHALSFAATHVGAMRLIFRETPEVAAGRAQTLYAALASGLFMGLSTLGSGWLYDVMGVHGYWVMAGLALTGMTIALPLLAGGAKSLSRVRTP